MACYKVKIEIEDKDGVGEGEIDRIIADALFDRGVNMVNSAPFEKIEDEGMPLWRIPVDWAMCGEVKIRAESLEEALEYAKENLDDLPLPNGTYIDGSFAVGGVADNESIGYYRLYNMPGR